MEEFGREPGQKEGSGAAAPAHGRASESADPGGGPDPLWALTQHLRLVLEPALGKCAALAVEASHASFAATALRASKRRGPSRPIATAGLKHLFPQLRFPVIIFSTFVQRKFGNHELHLNTSLCRVLFSAT